MHRSKPYTILLVEDNPGDVRLTREALKHCTTAHSLHVVRDGIEALQYLHGNGETPTPDCILLDLNLPRLSGREVLNEIKQDPKLRRIPVIVLSTSESERDVADCYALHVNSYVVKPIDISHFIETIRAIEAFWLKTAVLPGHGE